MFHANLAKNAKGQVLRICLTQISRISRKHTSLALVCTIRLRALGKADKRGRSDAPSVRFVRSVWNQKSSDERNLRVFREIAFGPFGRRTPFRVKQKTTMEEDFVRSVRFVWVKTKNRIMRKTNPMQAINHKEKAKTSRNRGYVMKYPRIRDEISADI